MHYFGTTFAHIYLGDALLRKFFGGRLEVVPPSI